MPVLKIQSYEIEKDLILKLGWSKFSFTER